MLVFNGAPTQITQNGGQMWSGVVRWYACGGRAGNAEGRPVVVPAPAES